MSRRAATGVRKWCAHWIWVEKPPEYRNQYIYARRVFTLDSAPTSASLHISADTFYRLFVNGECVGRGPARSDPAWQSYDTYRVEGLLVKGWNVLAVEVNSFIRPRGGLLCQLEIKVEGREEPIIICTDERWRVKVSEAWSPRTLHNTHWDYSEVYDARKEPPGWTQPDFKDDDWETPFLLDTQDVGRLTVWRDVPLPPHTHTEPYFSLEPRDIPMMREEEIRPVKVVDKGEVEEIMSVEENLDVALEMALESNKPLRTCRIEGAENLLTEGAPPTVIENQSRSAEILWEDFEGIPTVKDAYIVLDFGRLVNAYLRLDVEGAEGSVVDIGFGQTMVDGRVFLRPYNYQCHGDRYILREGRQRWESFHWKNFRYVQLTFRNLKGPLRLHSFTALTTEYPAEQRGRFKCSDPVLNEVWDATTRTVRLCLHDSYMDNTYREKEIWTGDVSVVILGAFAAFGDIEATHRYLRLPARGQNRVGFFPSYWPTPWEKPHLPILEHNLQYVMRVGEYYWYGGNRTLIDELYPALFKFMRWLENYRDEHGLLNNVPLYRWIDWAHTDLRGEALVTNIMYYACLRYVAEIARAYGRPQDADHFSALADQIPAAIQERFWNEERGLYVDCVVDDEQSDRFSEHANYMVLLFDMADEERRRRILENLANPRSDIVQVEPSFMLYPLQALFHVGEDKKAMDLMRQRYNRFFSFGSDTLWEEWSHRCDLRYGYWWTRSRSMAQGASCCPSYVLSTEVLGVKPIEPGFTRFEVRPKCGDLSWAEGVVPAPTGDIAVRWEKDAKGLSLKVTVPEGTEAEVWLPKAEEHRLDGKPVEESPLVKARREEPEGTVYTVEAGHYSFWAGETCS